MKQFLRIYEESEELIYKMCNEKGLSIRKNAINKNLRIIHLVSDLWRKGMVAPSGIKILKQIENGKLKVSIKKFRNLKMMLNKYKLKTLISETKILKVTNK